MFYSLYQACQNNFLIIALERDFDWKNNMSFRETLCKLGKEKNIDSILILTGNPWRIDELGYHCTMEVFEPRSNSISTMCGNGVRAVGQFWIDSGFLPEDRRFLINTKSGIRKVDILSNSLFKANMGTLSFRVFDLRKYVNSEKLLLNGSDCLDNISFNDKFLERLRVERAIIGMTGNRVNGYMDGEPHLIFFLKKRKVSLRQLNKYATKIGEMFSKNKKMFPSEINISVVVENSDGILSLCTYERGVYYVTKACGTANAVAAGYFLKKSDLSRIVINNLGGKLLVETNHRGNIYLTGNASSHNDAARF